MQKKQIWNDLQWQKAFEESKYRPKLPLIEKIKVTQDLIQKIYDENVVIGWSGGKDSIVLRHLCEQVLKNPVFEHCYMENDFIVFVDWIKKNKPDNCYEIHFGKQSADFFNEHPEALFPFTREEKRMYPTARNKDFTYRWMKKNNFNKIMTGKRIDDGNICGKHNALGCPSTISGNIEALNVIAEWTVYDVFQYIHLFGLELPPMYYFPEGFIRGTEEWTHTARKGTYKNTFDFISSFAKEDIEKASENGMVMAQKYLAGELTI